MAVNFRGETGVWTDLGVQTRWGEAKPPSVIPPPKYPSLRASTGLRTFEVILSKRTALKVAFGEVDTLDPLLSWGETIGAKSGGHGRVLRSEGSGEGLCELSLRCRQPPPSPVGTPADASLGGRDASSAFLCSGPETQLSVRSAPP